VPSLIRLLGLTIGLALILLAVWRRRANASRAEILFEVLGGLGLLATAIFPEIFLALQSIIGLEDRPLSRLVTVLIVTSAILFLLTLYSISRSERVSQRLSRLIRALSAAQLEHDSSSGRLGGILVCIPAYNEAESLGAVIAEIPAEIAGLRTHVLVIDDASRDRTRQVATEAGAHVVSHPVNGGQGAALQTGYLVAERIGVDVVVTMDADGQHDPTQIERLVGPIVAGSADFVVGTRRAGEYEREAGRDGAARNAGITVFTSLINVLGGTQVSDVANGFRAIRASRLSEIVFTEDQFHNPELLIGASRAGLRIEEVPVTIRRRSAGTSKKGGTFRYGFGFLRVIVRTWLR
jgi:hypothetical protein